MPIPPYESDIDIVPRLFQSVIHDPRNFKVIHLANDNIVTNQE